MSIVITKSWHFSKMSEYVIVALKIIYTITTAYCVTCRDVPMERMVTPRKAHVVPGMFCQKYSGDINGAVF